MERDRYGFGLSTTSAEAAAAYNTGVEAILAGQGGWGEAWQRAVDADAEFALARGALAVAWSFAGSRTRAERLAVQAEQLTLGSERERSHVHALTAWARAAPDAIERLVGHVERCTVRFAPVLHHAGPRRQGGAHVRRPPAAQS
jgi:hypothetical protein